MKVFFGWLSVIIVILGLSLSFGWFDVFYTKTVGKAKQNAQREVFEQTQSYVEGMRQDAIKLFKEYNQAKTPEDKKIIANTVAHKFSNFDQSKITEPELYSFIKKCKYGEL